MLPESRHHSVVHLLRLASPHVHSTAAASAGLLETRLVGQATIVVLLHLRLRHLEVSVLVATARAVGSHLRLGVAAALLLGLGRDALRSGSWRRSDVAGRLLLYRDLAGAKVLAMLLLLFRASAARVGNTLGRVSGALFVASHWRKRQRGRVGRHSRSDGRGRRSAAAGAGPGLRSGRAGWRGSSRAWNGNRVSRLHLDVRRLRLHNLVSTGNILRPRRLLGALLLVGLEVRVATTRLLLGRHLEVSVRTTTTVVGRHHLVLLLPHSRKIVLKLLLNNRHPLLLRHGELLLLIDPTAHVIILLLWLVEETHVGVRMAQTLHRLLEIASRSSNRSVQLSV